METDDRRLVILLNGAETKEDCVYCLRRFILRAGYQILAQDGNAPAMATLPVCRPCAEEREPALVEMLDLSASYARFAAGSDSTMSERVPAALKFSAPELSERQ